MWNRKENRNKYANLSKEKKEEGFEKEKVTPSQEPKKQQTPNEEVPNVGDHEKQGPTIKPSQNSLNENVDTNDDKEESLAEIVSQSKEDLKNGTLNK